MPRFKVEAISTHTYVVYVEAPDEGMAYESLNDWISDDFEPFEVDAHWQTTIIEEDEDDNSEAID